MKIKPMSVEESLSVAGSTVSLASAVRLINTGAATTVSVVDVDDNEVAKFTIAAGEVVVVNKAPTHTLSAAASVKAVKVADL